MNDSLDSVGGWDTLTLNHPHPKVIIRATELNHKNTYVLQIGPSLCCKLGQNVLQIGAGITN